MPSFWVESYKNLKVNTAVSESPDIIIPSIIVISTQILQRGTQNMNRWKHLSVLLKKQCANGGLQKMVMCSVGEYAIIYFFQRQCKWEQLWWQLALDKKKKKNNSVNEQMRGRLLSNSSWQGRSESWMMVELIRFLEVWPCNTEDWLKTTQLLQAQIKIRNK